MRVQQASHLEKELAHLEELMAKEEYEETRAEEADRRKLEQIEEVILEA
jgi:hypothetical protein